MAFPDRKPDAVLSPCPSGMQGVAKHTWLRDQFFGLIARPQGDSLNAKPQGQQTFLSPTAATLLFPVLHPLAGKERYDWYVVAEDIGLNWLVSPVKVAGYGMMPGAVKFGFLKDEALIDPPSMDEKAAFASFVVKRDADYSKGAARLKALSSKPDRTKEESEEMTKVAEDLAGIADRSYGQVELVSPVSFHSIKWPGGLH